YLPIILCKRLACIKPVAQNHSSCYCHLRPGKQNTTF
ncbi:hypothetical protein Leryth_003634, partial [Lithospermum erythrorhizon]